MDIVKYDCGMFTSEAQNVKNKKKGFVIMKKVFFQSLIAAILIVPVYAQTLSQDEEIFTKYFAQTAGTMAVLNPGEVNDTSLFNALEALERIIKENPSRYLLKLIHLNLSSGENIKAELLKFVDETPSEFGDIVMLALYEYIVSEKEFYPEVVAKFSGLKGTIPFQISPPYLYFIECWSSVPAKMEQVNPKPGDLTILKDKSEENLRIYPDEKEYFRENYQKGLSYFKSLEIIDDKEFPLSLFRKYEPAIAAELVRLTGEEKWKEPAHDEAGQNLIQLYNSFFLPLFADIYDEEYLLKTAGLADDGSEFAFVNEETVFCYLAENNINSPVLPGLYQDLKNSIENVSPTTFDRVCAYTLKNHEKELISLVDRYLNAHPESISAYRWKKYFYSEINPDKNKVQEIEIKIEELTPKAWSVETSLEKIKKMIDSLYYKAAEDSLLKMKDDLEQNLMFISNDYFSVLSVLRGLYIQTGELSKSLDVQTRKYEVIKQYFMKGNELRMKTEVELAENYNLLGQFTASRAILLEVLANIDSLDIKESNSFSGALLALSEVYLLSGDQEKGEKLVDSVYNMVISGKIRDKEYLNELVIKLSDFYLKSGKPEKVEKLIEVFNLLQPEKGTGSRYRAVRMKSELALLKIQKGNKEDAGTILGEISSDFIELPVAPDKDWMRAFGNIAELHNKMPYNKGHRNFIKFLKRNSNKILEVRDPAFVEALTNIVEFYHREGDFNPAQDFLFQVIKKQKQNFGELNPDYILMTVKLIELMGRRGKSEEFFGLYKELIDLQARYLREVLPLLTESERELMMRKFIGMNELCMSVSIKNFEMDMAVYGLYYDNLLRIKGLKLAALKNERQRLRKIYDPGQLEIIKKLNDVKNLIGKLYNFSKDELAKTGYDLSSLQNDANTLQAELNKNLKPGTDSLIDLSITWHTVRKNLKPGEAAIEIFRFRPYDNGFLDSVVYLYLIVTPETMDHPEIGFQFNGKFIEGEPFQAYLDAVKSLDVDIFEEMDIKVLKEAYNNYWLPIQYHLQGVKKIYLSADGLYHKINPAVLVNPSTNKYVYEEYEIELVGSTREIVTKNLPKESNNKGSWLFGYPELYDFKFNENKNPLNQEPDRAVFSGDDKSELQRYYLSDIPATKTEVEKIDSLLRNHKKESVLFTGVKASEENIKNMKKPTVLHIASHGYFIKDDEVSSDKIYGFDKRVVALNPLLRSGLFLAGAGAFLESDPFSWKGNENGVLTAQECLTLDLDGTELVTLSACETGLGIVQNGEGVYGLQRALMVSGAKSVIMSLWKVHDSATMEFMVGFYAEWLKSGDKIKAFDLARQTVRAKYKLPYYWGAFILLN